MTRARALNILVLAQDLSDAAIQRRITMLQTGGAVVSVAGFRRTPEPIPMVAGRVAVDFGQTYGGKFLSRIFSVLRTVIILKRHRALFETANIIVARNLEMLAVGVRGRSLCAQPPKLVYECLDIHRLLLSKGLVGALLRALEGWLSKRASGLITSSPAFVDNYFDAISRVCLPVRIIENKNLNLTGAFPAPASHIAGPPWKIGWFGVIRCRKSLQILTDLVKNSGGAIEVIIRGKPALDQFENFHKSVNAMPGLRFFGPYKSPDDLAAIYQEVHFNWTIDMFEEGLNSSWLLPNRLYEGGMFGVTPLAQSSVETGRFLKRLNIGATLSDPLDTSLKQFFAILTPEKYQALAADMRSVPQSFWTYGKSDCEELVAWLESVGRP